MLTFLFWNLKQPKPEILASLVQWHAVDVMMLTECPIQPASILEALNEHSAEFYYARCDCPKIQIYTRFSDEFLRPQSQHDDFTISRLELPNRPNLLLCIVHLPSKLRQNPIDQTIYSVNLGDWVAEAEEAVKHTRTILVGDLNMNPYDDGVVTTRGLHAVMTRAIARRESRRVKFESNLFFYNPMWAFFGEQDAGHAGTYFYSSPKTRADYWNIYDQVLVRPQLLSHFDRRDVAILHRDEASNISFLKGDGLPDSETVSDHLPILFRLNL